MILVSAKNFESPHGVEEKSKMFDSQRNPGVHM